MKGKKSNKKEAPKEVPSKPPIPVTSYSDKGYSKGSLAPRKFILEYLLRLLTKKLEENPEGAIKKGKTIVKYADMKKEVETWIKVWF